MSFRPLFSFLTALVFSQLATGQSVDKLRILTSIPPLYSWAVNVAGDLAVVENLLPADVGPHEFQLRPKDLEKIQRADLVFINGLGLESWLERTLATGPKANRLRVWPIQT
jgi:ABC-type Zn uptake system ZnuABC Zn-binding protein ZnuA